MFTSLVNQGTPNGTFKLSLRTIPLSNLYLLIDNTGTSYYYVNPNKVWDP